MPPTPHEQQYGVDVWPVGTTLHYGLGVYFGPNRIMAAMALPRGDVFGPWMQIDNLRVLASVEGSMDYQRLYQEVQAYYVNFTLDRDPVKATSHLFKNGFPLVEDLTPLLKEITQEPPSQRLQYIFFQQLRIIKERAEQNLGHYVQISAISLPSYWYDEFTLKDAVLAAATQLEMDIPRDMLLGHEATARLAYNIHSLKSGTWFLVLVEYNTKNLYLTFTEMSDREDPEEHEKYRVHGRYLLENLGEKCPTRAEPDAKHYTNIKKAFDQSILKHVTKYPPWTKKVPYYNIKGIILTGDASKEGIRKMDKILHQVFDDLPKCVWGNMFTDLKHSHVMALGAARAVRSKVENGDVLRDVYRLVAIEDGETAMRTHRYKEKQKAKSST